MEKEIKTIGVLTSGGDAPGMNACIRAVVRSALNQNRRVMGVQHGYAGLLKGEISEMDAKSVANIIHRGGTSLYTARCPEFVREEYQAKAAQMCRIFGIDALVVIGGDGTFRGAQALARQGINVVGIPATIDLDVACSEYTIGFDTSINIVMEAVARLRDTSASHERCSIVEVMGHHCGAIALWAGLVTGADAVMIPEVEETHSFDYIVRTIMENRKRGKNHNIIIVSEGCYDVARLASEVEELTGINSRATVLGHIQRGGSPTALDVKHASMMGELAVRRLCEGANQRVIAVQGGRYVDLDMEEALNMEKRSMDEVWQANMNISKY